MKCWSGTAGDGKGTGMQTERDRMIQETDIFLGKYNFSTHTNEIFFPSFQGKVVTETTTEYKEAATGDDSGFSDFGPSFTSSSSPFQLKRETKVKKIRLLCLPKFCHFVV